MTHLIYTGFQQNDTYIFGLWSVNFVAVPISLALSVEDSVSQLFLRVYATHKSLRPTCVMDLTIYKFRSVSLYSVKSYLRAVVTIVFIFPRTGLTYLVHPEYAYKLQGSCMLLLSLVATNRLLYVHHKLHNLFNDLSFYWFGD